MGWRLLSVRWEMRAAKTAQFLPNAAGLIARITLILGRRLDAPPVMSAPHHSARISLRLREIGQLFNSMDPSPFLDRDLDGDAEEFILSSARELPRAHGFELLIHLTASPDSEKSFDVEAAVQHYFAARALIKRREFQLMLRRGHLSLAIGLLFLSTCLLASSVAGRIAHDSIVAVVREGFIIVGWVAMWRPLETFLYDWWPVRQEWRILQQLASMRVRITLPHSAETITHTAAAPAHEPRELAGKVSL